jgi:hypothetical protein
MGINERSATHMGITRTRPAANEDEDYTPRKTTRATEDDGFTDEAEDTPAVGSGWGAAKKVMSETSSFTDSFRFPDKDSGEQPALIKFPEDAPFASFKQHWVDEIKDGKRSWACLERKCPLCARGHQPRAMIVFNVIDIGRGQVMPLEAGPMLAKILENENDGRSGPLSRPYWEVYRTGGGKKGKVVYTINAVKARDLADDFGLDADEVAATVLEVGEKLLDASWVKFPKQETLQEIAEEHLSD